MDAVDVIRKKLANPSVGQCDDYAEYLTEWAESIVSALTASGHLMGWIPIDQYDPAVHGAEVDLWASGVREADCVLRSGKWHQWDYGRGRWDHIVGVTHFRTLPTPPVGEE